MHYMVVKYGVLSDIIAILVGTNTQLNLYMLSFADTFYTYKEKHEKMPVEPN